MSLVNRVIHDGDTESLIRKYLKAGVMVNGRYEESETAPHKEEICLHS